MHAAISGQPDEHVAGMFEDVTFLSSRACVMVRTWGHFRVSEAQIAALGFSLVRVGRKFSFSTCRLSQLHGPKRPEL